jgi:RNA polymerase sigma-70 factor (ECF subfamily)
MNDSDIVARCRAGDLDAFESLYRRHAPRVYSLACRMAGSAADGEDLLQEIFLLAYRKLESFKGEAAIGTWLYRLAVNHCVDFVRSRHWKQARLTETLNDERAPEPPVLQPSPILRLELDHAVDQLPPGCREVFVLHDVEGFDHKEISRMLGIAEGTSKSQVFKARMKLRALLRPAPLGRT